LYKQSKKRLSIKKVMTVLFLANMTLFAEADLQESVYDSAEEMMQFDEKMNRLIAEHNGVDYEEEKMNAIVDFEEKEKSYLLEREIEDNDNTQIELSLKDGLLTIDTTVREQEKLKTETGIGHETTITKSSMSLYVPADADEDTMQEIYKNGILKITFLKK